MNNHPPNEKAESMSEERPAGLPAPLEDIARQIAVLIVKQHRYLLAHEEKPG